MNERQSVQRFLRGAALLLCLGVSAQAVTSYRVQPGDTLGGIAARAGVSAAQIRAVNARLRGTDQVQAGWVLTLPDRTLPARTHTVKNGENLSVIAARYGLSLGALLNANPAYRNGKAVWTGARLNIPARTSSSASAAAAPAARSTATVRTASSSGRSGGWLWPVSGHHGVSSGYGPRVLGGVREDHWGVDIVAPVGTPVRAARSGRVLESRPDFDRGWGWTVVLEHPDGWITRYAHLSANLVQKGELVVRGQPVGRVGNTGRSTGPHLHFGTYLRWDPRDPLSLY
ncbi:M23 family metallopeptidase [Deinococcus aquaticus]|uniref:M23 family metallopeptidase n=1 Tax=Deinococcus aquaticus TaxID=328692 RepID=A0ABY7V486_9DEIO|nr:M23 family metallopeptidase [Deinococcus aquaticus]WDA59540.1 M23 family metallopeptidase [Deinococcus aquaticus]